MSRQTVNGATLAGIRVVEGASFVAGPSAGLTLAQWGAEVIRVDPPGGASDIHRWPVTESGTSLFWTNLNKGKRSVTIDYRKPEGRDLYVQLITADHAGGGIFLDNMVGRHRLSYEELEARRSDVIHVHVEGKRDGSPAVDYTVNAETGVPLMTGPENAFSPTNHVLPAWDLLTGMTAASGLLAALHQRAVTGKGARLDIALTDVALAGVGSMGWLAEADLSGAARRPHGNHMYGSFGVDFETAGGRRIMVVALTEAQWRALRDVTETGPVFAALEDALDADLDQEADRYRLRETIAAVLRPWFADRDFETVRDLLTRARVLWSPYADMAEVVQEARSDPGSLMTEIDQPGVGRMLATGNPLRWHENLVEPVPAPALGRDTEAVLQDVLGLTSTEIGRLHDSGIVDLQSIRKSA
jgi:2-methylfumaryl-CoA isomerase